MSGYSKYRSFGLLLIFVVLFLFPMVSASPGFAAPAPTPTLGGYITIKEALDRGLIKLTLTGNGELFYHNPIHYMIENLTPNAQKIVFPAGQLLVPNDIAYQAFVISMTVHIDLNLGKVPNHVVEANYVLAPNQVMEGDLPAFCINESRHSPSAGIEYQLGGMATGDLIKLAQVIESKSANGHLGAQLAVWALTDKITLNDFTATPSPDQPSLIDTIQPLLCLAQDEIDLGQQLLVEAGVSERLYTGGNPITSYCQNKGIPSISQIEQQAKNLGERALLFIGLGACGCIIVIVVIVLLAIRLFRKRK